MLVADFRIGQRIAAQYSAKVRHSFGFALAPLCDYFARFALPYLNAKNAEYAQSCAKKRQMTLDWLNQLKLVPLQ